MTDHSRRNFLKGAATALGVTITGLGVGAKIQLPDGREGEIETIETVETQEGETEVKAHVLLYWYCPKCGGMNTQGMPKCKMCQTPFDGERTITTSLTHTKTDPWEYRR
jgi:hypothetical protein